jgi:hypothetical protein
MARTKLEPFVEEEITLRMYHNPCKVKAKRLGNFAYHGLFLQYDKNLIAKFSTKAFGVTMLPSGYNIFTFDTKKQAEAAIRVLHSYGQCPDDPYEARAFFAPHAEEIQTAFYSIRNPAGEATDEPE